MVLLNPGFVPLHSVLSLVTKLCVVCCLTVCTTFLLTDQVVLASLQVVDPVLLDHVVIPSFV